MEPTNSFSPFLLLEDLNIDLLLEDLNIDRWVKPFPLSDTAVKDERFSLDERFSFLLLGWNFDIDLISVLKLANESCKINLK